MRLPSSLFVGDVARRLQRISLREFVFPFSLGDFFLGEVGEFDLLFSANPLLHFTPGSTLPPSVEQKGISRLKKDLDGIQI